MKTKKAEKFLLIMSTNAVGLSRSPSYEGSSPES